MRWSERQVAMLEEMGIRLWTPPATAPDKPAASAVLVEPAAPTPASAPPAAARPAARGLAIPQPKPPSAEPEGTTAVLRLR